MLRINARITFLALTLLAATAASIAEQAPSAGPDSDDEQSKFYSWGLGLAGLTKQTAYRDIDRDNMAVPLIYFENRWFNWFGLEGEFTPLPKIQWGESQELSFGLALQYDPSGYEAKDSPFLRGMDERKSGFWTGISSKWNNPLVDVSAKWLIDASNESKGQQISIGLERSYFVGKHFMLTPSVSATYVDKKYADYYYGVRSAEARADRPAYVVDSTVNAEVALRTTYEIDQHQSALLLLQYSALGSEIKNSPLIEKSGETMVLLGYLYRF
jgi:MipA family protein